MPRRRGPSAAGHGPRGEFAVDDPPTLARVIQTATMKFCDPRLVAQYQDEPLEDQAHEVMPTLIGGLPPVRMNSSVASR